MTEVPLPSGLPGIALAAALFTAGVGGWLAVHFLLARRPALAGGVRLLHLLGALATLAGLGAIYGMGDDAGAHGGFGPEFRTLAWWLLLPTAALGLASFAARRRSRALRGGLMAVHATLAVFAVTLLLAAAIG